ncbi:MAG: GNAT family N-acetyltransferase [Acidobacteriota bacterium]|jgi:GNAT superfamily N-acetyltransferase|nr:GNAT family N-acetyltransferase [Acidobacteriota bacterium]
MPHLVHVEIIDPDQWRRVRDIRLRSLQVNPEAFGGTFEIESIEDEATWREKFIKNDFLIASIDGHDAAIMYIEVLDGDFGATCWIGGCWSDPAYRGKGLFSAMMKFVDAQDRGWEVQGLGVWTNNDSAIAAYEKLGFVKMGEDTPSSRQPGKFYQRMIRKS